MLLLGNGCIVLKQMFQSERIRAVGEPGDLGWIVMAHGELYAHEYGWDRRFEALVARIVADCAAEGTPKRARGWIAETDDKRSGSVFCVPADDHTAMLRLLLVHPRARGHGLGRRLVDTCVQFAETAGYQRLRLWTNHPLSAARRIYIERGFQLVEEHHHSSWGAELTGQTYELVLGPARPEGRDPLGLQGSESGNPGE